MDEVADLFADGVLHERASVAAAAGAPEGKERERCGVEAGNEERREDAVALRRPGRREEGEAAAEAEGWRQTARVEIWVGRWMVEGEDFDGAELMNVIKAAFK